MELLSNNSWEILYHGFAHSINDVFDLYVLSDYDDGSGTFIIVSPLFIGMEEDLRDRWISNLLVSLFDQDLIQGCALTPKEFVVSINSDYLYESSIEAYIGQSA